MPISKTDFKIILNHMNQLSPSNIENLIKDTTNGNTTNNEINKLIKLYSASKVTKLMNKINNLLIGGGENTATSSEIPKINKAINSATSSKMPNYSNNINSATSSEMPNYSATSSEMPNYSNSIDSATSSEMPTLKLNNSIDSATSSVMIDNTNVNNSATSSEMVDNTIQMLNVPNAGIDNIKDDIKQLIIKLGDKSNLLKQKEIELNKREMHLNVRENIINLKNSSQNDLMQLEKCEECKKSSIDSKQTLQLTIPSVNTDSETSEQGIFAKIFS